MKLNDIKTKDWKKRWAGSYTFISCSNYGWQYCNSMKKHLGAFFEYTLHIHKQGVVSCYIPQSELVRVGNEVNIVIQKNPELAKTYLQNVKTLTDKLLPLMNENVDNVPTWESYKRFLDLFDEYLAYHVFMKELIDYLPPEVTEPLFSEFSDARAYSEPIYSQSERFFRGLMKVISQKENISADYLTCINRSELEEYLKTGRLPSAEALQDRYNFSVIYYNLDNEITSTGEQAKNIENLVITRKIEDKNIIKGITAYGGKIKGRCRIILDPYNHGKFEPGAILVTGMTRPEFIPLMKLASAFITDAGGMLCHAAITAREMKKPCVIGTEIATKVLKDGDIVEVDANKGIVRVLTKAMDPE